MRKILGTKKQLYTQENNAQVYLFDDYFGKKKYIACAPTICAMGFDIAGRPMNVFTSGVQPEDSILMMLHNPSNLKALKEIRDLDYDKYPPNEVPQVYDFVGRILYGVEACRFEWGLTFDIIKVNIDNRIPMMILVEFDTGGHYDLVVGYDDLEKKIIYNDPYPRRWIDKNGYNREMDLAYFNKKVKKWRVDFYPPN